MHPKLVVCEIIHIFCLAHDFGAPGIHRSRSLLCSSFFLGLGSIFGQRLVVGINPRHFVVVSTSPRLGICMFRFAQPMGETKPRILGVD